MSTANANTPMRYERRAVVDPTANVIALVQAEASSAAKLREADIKFNDAQHAHLKEVSMLRAANAETLRVSDLDRLGKTREVDVLAGAASAAALATAVQTLANTSDRNAETLRNLVNATAQTMAKQTADQAQVLSSQTDSLVKDINARIAELQKSSYQGVGKSSVADPLMAEFIAEMRTLTKRQATDTGKSVGGQAVWGYVAAAIGFGLSIVGLTIGAVTLMLRFGGG